LSEPRFPECKDFQDYIKTNNFNFIHQRGNTMRTQLFKIAQAATFGIAMAFTFSCSSGGDGGGSENNIANYRTVKIGNQTWMAENLNYNASGSKCYDNQESNCAQYGRLYDWTTARTVCPSGWHLPTQAEWNTLRTAVGGSATAGTKLKAISGWWDGNGTDAYGFAALPGGRGYEDGYFSDAGSLGRWWSASDIDASLAYAIEMNLNGGTDWDNSKKSRLFSVRCLKN
jgi:uncharacterized protein (TIGR02145 family)